MAASPHRGKLIVDGRAFPCALGRSAIVSVKREGDGGTPRGRFRLIGLWRRPDRKPLRCLLPTRRIRPDQGWCDAPDHRLYNRPVRLPFAASHEAMWRSDHLYDLVADIDWNRGPIIKGKGSAIFLHAARPDYSATAGCVALSPGDLRRLFGRISRNCLIQIE
ncbi:MAG: L,D-transpeptidase family protein [Beijerinckiaceae bacterium]